MTVKTNKSRERVVNKPNAYQIMLKVVMLNNLDCRAISFGIRK